MTGRGGSQQILENLEHAHLFLVCLDNQRQWYRYHHLFSDFLRARLDQIESTTDENAAQIVASLHQRASSWLEENGLFTEAIDQCYQASDVENLSRLIESNAFELFNQSKLITLLTWMKRLPTEQFKSRPLLSIICAWAHLATSRFESVEHFLVLQRQRLAQLQMARRLKRSSIAQLCSILECKWPVHLHGDRNDDGQSQTERPCRVGDRHGDGGNAGVHCSHAGRPEPGAGDKLSVDRYGDVLG